ncbi:MAG: hypothetical protein EOP83_12630 [Verrucomicrobiaceae bacterium]|nr:MAG: hypothetical protein EOP83_12630 [Verrucomicrobiaceae bacterium]
MILQHLMLQHRDPDSALAVAYFAAPDAFPGLPRSKGQLKVKLLKVPSFEPYSAWALFEHEGSYRIRRIEWDHGMKLAKMPGTYGSEAELDASTAAALLSELASITIPAVQASKAWGLDGVSYAIAIGSFWCSSEFSWWSEPPAGWSELAAWYDRALAAFESALPVSTLRNPELQYRQP